MGSRSKAMRRCGEAELEPSGLGVGLVSNAVRLLAVSALIALGVVANGCGPAPRGSGAVEHLKAAPFSFDVVVGPSHYQIEGYIVRGSEPGRLPAVLVLNGGEGDARRCVAVNGDLAAILGIRVACISIPGYGRSSGPGRLVGPQAVAAARRALDLLAARPDVDPDRLAVWGVADGAVAAGLLMDGDRCPRSFILQSGAYDMVKLWPEAPLRTKLRMLRQVWPSRRVLEERSVVEHLPRRLDCSVLILHGARDKRTPVKQATELARELRDRGARVFTDYFPDAQHDLGAKVRKPVKEFLRETLLSDAGNPA
jgi:dipeptidyl aminopeptidase/acylaminoacyl peptidase